MAQVEHGLMSGCKCPECANECHDCMGSVQPPMSIEELKLRAGALLNRTEDGEDAHGKSEE